MIKVMIAVKEPEVRKNFKIYIGANFPEMNIAADYLESESLLEGIERCGAQLIIADMRFFGFSVISVIKDIFQKHPECRFLLYGEYSDSDYVQRLYDHGLIDFIYRPVTPNDLKRCLQSAMGIFHDMERMSAVKDASVQQFQQNREFFQDRFLLNLINGNLSSEDEIKSSLKHFAIKLTGEFTVMLVHIDNFSDMIQKISEEEKHLLSFQINRLVAEKIRMLEAISFIRNFDEICIILGKSPGLESIVELCAKIKNEVFFQYKFSVTVGAGRTYDTLNQIHASYKEATSALRYRQYYGHNSVIPIHYVEPRNSVAGRYPLDKENMLVYAAVTGQYEYCELLLKKLFAALSEGGVLPEGLLQKTVFSIIFSINRRACELGMEVGKRFNEFFPTKDVFELKTVAESYAYLSKRLEDFCGFMLTYQNRDKLRILDEAKQYISANYFTNVSLHKLAVRVKTTPEFLSRLFAESLHMSVGEYSLYVRIERAKALSLESEDDQIIAASLGYDDVKLFRTVFRQQTGVSVYEYRNANKIMKRNSSARPEIIVKHDLTYGMKTLEAVETEINGIALNTEDSNNR